MELGEKRGAKREGPEPASLRRGDDPQQEGPARARLGASSCAAPASFDAEIRVTREGHTVGGTSIMGLMMLAAGQGHRS